MVAATYTYVTVIDELRKVINDKPAATADQWMTDAQYEQFIFNRFESIKTTAYVFTLMATGVWTYGTNGSKLYLYDMSMSGKADCAYRLMCDGSIRLTAGTDTTASYTVSGTPVNFRELIIDICQYLITHMAQRASVNAGGASFSPQDEQRLIRIMETWRGVVAL